jgi:hypothetical protein
MKRNVSVVCVCSAHNCCNTEQRSASQPGSVTSGTPVSPKNFCAVDGPYYIIKTLLCRKALKAFVTLKNVMYDVTTEL